MLNMKYGESLDDYFAHTLVIINQLHISKVKIDDVDISSKVFRSMTPKFNYMVC